MPTGGGMAGPGATLTDFFPRRALRSILGFFCSDIESPRQDAWRRFLTGNAGEEGRKVTVASDFGKIEFATRLKANHVLAARRVAQRFSPTTLFAWDNRRPEEGRETS